MEDDNNTQEIVDPWMYSIMEYAYHMMKLRQDNNSDQKIDSTKSVVERCFIARKMKMYDYIEIMFVNKDELVVGSIMLNCATQKEPLKNQMYLKGDREVIRISIDEPLTLRHLCQTKQMIKMIN